MFHSVLLIFEIPSVALDPRPSTLFPLKDHHPAVLPRAILSENVYVGERGRREADAESKTARCFKLGSFP